MSTSTLEAPERTADAQQAVIIRQATPDDAEACGRIIFEAFKSIHDRHRFARDFQTLEDAARLASMFIAHPQIYGVVAEKDGRVVGSNFLDERNPVRGVGPITVDPTLQERGVGRRLMKAVIERGADATGIRLVQDSFNTLSLSLYASLGFDVREPLALVQGKLDGGPVAATGEVRPLEEDDLDECAALSERVHGFERNGELRDAREFFKPFVLVKGGRIRAYASAPTFWQLNHGVAETEGDMRALLLGASAASDEPLSLLVPVRQTDFFRWCLAEGLRVVKPMNLMTKGMYREPEGFYFPSVEY